jgi:hypothetical protein
MSGAAGGFQPTTITALGGGPLALVPAGSTFGTPLPTLSPYSRGVMLYCYPGESVSYTVAGSQPLSAPAAVQIYSGSTSGPNCWEPLSAGMEMFILAVSGSPRYRTM